MLWIVLSMLVIVAVALLVILYVAFPRRGERLPRAGWVGDALGRGVERLPTLHNSRS